MRVFVTGASGHLGSAVVPELQSAGHDVVGFARSDASAATLENRGVEVLRGDLDDFDGLRRGVEATDGTIHLAFKHEAMRAGNFLGAVDSDLRAIEAMGEALLGTGKPFVSTSGTLLLAQTDLGGRTGTEKDALSGGPRIDAENMVVNLAERGVRSSVVRLPPVVHSTLDQHGFAHTLISIARGTQTAGYVDEGSNRWPAVHTLDAARVYRLALEIGRPGMRFHAVADEGVPFREIAELVGRRLRVPTRSVPTGDAAEHFSPLGAFVALDNPTSSALTQESLGWSPTEAGLLEDLDSDHYFAA